MSDKIWKCKGYKAGRRGKRRADRSSQFPRSKVNIYEGTKLGKRRLWGSMTAWCGYRGAYIRNNIIKGLLIKYIGKPYSEFEKVFKDKIKPIKNKLLYNPLNYLIDFNKKDNYIYSRKTYYKAFYIEKGILRVKRLPPKRKYLKI